MKRVIGLTILSSIVIALVVWLASIIFSFSFGEWSFLIGLGLSILLFFANSSGGALSKGATYAASETSGKIQKGDDMKVNLGAFFYGSALFTIVNLIIMLSLYL